MWKCQRPGDSASRPIVESETRTWQHWAIMFLTSNGYYTGWQDAGWQDAGCHTIMRYWDIDLALKQYGSVFVLCLCVGVNGAKEVCNSSFEQLLQYSIQSINQCISICIIIHCDINNYYEYTYTYMTQIGVVPKITRIGVFARGQILGISLNGLQAGHCYAPGIMSAVS